MTMRGDMMNETAEVIDAEIAEPVMEMAPTLSITDIEAMLAAEREPAPEPFPGDAKATWDYWTGLSNPPEGPDTALVWARLRHRRNVALAASDFRMVSDAPWDTAPWGAYRQALRDMTDTLDPRKAVWPAEPE